MLITPSYPTIWGVEKYVAMVTATKDTSNTVYGPSWSIEVVYKTIRKCGHLISRDIRVQLSWGYLQ